MTCHLCGGEVEETITDLPFKIAPNSIIIIKDLPVLQCQNCHEYSLDDPVMAGVDDILSKIGEKTELEVLKYAG